MTEAPLRRSSNASERPEMPPPTMAIAPGALVLVEPGFIEPTKVSLVWLVTAAIFEKDPIAVVQLSEFLRREGEDNCMSASIGRVLAECELFVANLQHGKLTAGGERSLAVQLDPDVLATGDSVYGFDLISSHLGCFRR
ncbi:MAG TPA: hypothetical protein VKB87_12095 [Myxococcaceae bacterium]|nr:hypothetical protein [Myxococcaceae bacterium]